MRLPCADDGDVIALVVTLSFRVTGKSCSHYLPVIGWRPVNF